MKKYMALMLSVLTVICCLTACGNKEDSTGGIPAADVKIINFATTRKPEEPTTVKSDKTVRVNVPGALVESQAGGDLDKYAATYGYKIDKEKDGSVTMEMNGITYSLMLSNVGMEIMMFLGSIVDSGDYPYAVKLQDYTQDFSYILMLVDTKEYKKHKKDIPYEDLSFLIGQCGLYYQYFTLSDENRCEVILADSVSGKVVHRQTYTD